MKLVSFRLRNNKSFSDSGELLFGDGFNVIVGQNNAGKSALLQGISLRFKDSAHLSLRTKPTVTSPVSPQSEALFSIECSGEELRTALLNGEGGFALPIPQGSPNKKEVAQSILDDVFASPRIEITLRRTGDGAISAVQIPSFSTYTADENIFIIQPAADRTGFVFEKGMTHPNCSSIELGALAGKAFLGQIYFFHAERLALGESSYGATSVLSPDARNLPEVLNVLQSNKARYDRFNQYVNQILPTIRRVAVRPNPNGPLQIVVWSVDPGTERDDLAISLADSGTGVGQVLAILYVAVMSPQPRTIVIDEPNSFLNPGAAKKLIEILRGFEHLQFIISTHSPEIVRAAQPRTLSIIHWADGISTVEQMESTSMNSLHLVLKEVGASLSDVFGADRVLWVEGPTEEVCFRHVIERCLKRPLMGTSIAAVRDVGRLTSHRPSAILVWEIYSKLSGAGAMMPPALAFSFDRDGRSMQEITDIQRQSNNRVHFLPRRMYENYLLDIDAIAAVMSAEIDDTTISAEDVRIWLESHRLRFLPSDYRNNEVDESTWLREVNGAGLLDLLFQEISNNNIVYEKVRHGSMLTESLIDNKPDALDELSGYLDVLTSVQN